MKIQIVQLEAHDDVISTRDKMGWGQTSRILLIWPSNGLILERMLDLTLLQRHSAALGAQLALVTRDETVCFNAQQLGIPTFPTLRQAQSPTRGNSANVSRQRLRRRSRLPRRLRLRKPKALADMLLRRQQAHPASSNWQSLPGVQLGAFALGVLAFLVLLIALIPGATITLEPRQETQTVMLPLTASPEIEKPRLTGELPAHWVSTVVEARGTITTTGQVQVPEKPATGSVTFTNLTTLPVDIPTGTIVRTTGPEAVRFSTMKAARIPAGPGSHQAISVQALSPGKNGNVPAQAIQSVEGALALKVSLTNLTALRGGSSQPAAGPSDADRQKLFAALSQTLQETARQELLSSTDSNLREGDFAILPSLKLNKVVEQHFQPEDSAPAEQLELTLRLEFLALVVSGQDLRAVAEPVLEASLPEGFTALPGSLQIEHLKTPAMQGAETASWQAEATLTIQANISPAVVVQEARGLPAARAAARLFGSLPLARPPEIHLFPGWWPYLPWVPLRIEVK